MYVGSYDHLVYALGASQESAGGILHSAMPIILAVAASAIAGVVVFYRKKM